MEFRDIMLQVTRPYWSPLHPSYYIRKQGARPMGWGLCYPEDIGAFNLMWVMSGVGGPPDDYSRYIEGSMWITALMHLPAGGYSLRYAAALMSMERFSKHLEANPKDTRHLGQLKAALRLKV